ncbi:MAG: hypothetical protein SCJ93_14395 [Bacillota bacterium]|nr:hypothetical protein [Bacillota bacterium]
MKKFENMILKERKNIMRKTKKLIAFLLVVCLISLIPINGYASDLSSSKQVFTDDVLGDFTFERTIEEDKVTVVVKTIEGKIVHTVVLENNILSIDGRVINKNISNLMDPLEYSNSMIMSRDSEWGPWLPFGETVILTGLDKFAIAAAFYVIAPHIGLSRSVVWAGYVFNPSYTEAEISGQIRYRSDDEYHYYERYTTLVVDGNTELDSFYDTGTTSLY